MNALFYRLPSFSQCVHVLRVNGDCGTVMGALYRFVRLTSAYDVTLPNI